MRRQRVFNLDAVHVFAAAVHHVLFAIQNLHKALIVDPRHITRVQPAVNKSFSGRFGFIPIAFHDVGTAYQQLAHITVGARFQLYVYDRSRESNCLRPQARVFMWQKRRHR